MKAAEKYKYWYMLSQYDLDTAKVLIDGERWVYVAYMCQQALERQLKGMYVCHMGKEAPKGHNLPHLFESFSSKDAFVQAVDPALLAAGKEPCEDFLVDVMFYYMSDYPFSYQKIASRFVDRKTALELYDSTLAQIEWLRSLQPLPQIVDVADMSRP